MSNLPSFKASKAAEFDLEQYINQDLYADEGTSPSEVDASEETGNTTTFLSDLDLDASQDSFGDKTQNITRNEIMDLFHKVQGSKQSNERELLDVLRDALRSESAHDQEGAWNNYEKVAGVFQSDNLTQEEGLNDPASENSDSQSDTPQPTSIEESTLGGKKFIYDNLKNSDYEFDADFNGPAKEYEISSNNGVIKINGIGSKDTMSVTKISDFIREVRVSKNGSVKANDTIVYRITGNPSKIILNTLPQNINGVDELDSLIQAGSKPLKTLWPSSADKLKTLVPSGGDGSTQAQTFLQKITDAINDGSNEKWTSAKDYLDSIWPSGKEGPGTFLNASQDNNGVYKNPEGKYARGRPLGPVAVRKAMTAIYAYVGNNPDKFKIIMSKISPELRIEMTNCLDWASKQSETSFGYTYTGSPNPDYVPPNPNYEYQKNQPGVKAPTPDLPKYLNIPNPKSYVGKTAIQDGDKWNNEEALVQLNDIPHMQTDNSEPSMEEEEY